GFGKSNLMKNILAELTVSEQTVGKLVFDLEGEYSFGGHESGTGEVGLGDIPLVAERLVVYSNAKRKEENYSALVAGEPVLNLGELSARKVVSTLLPEGRQDRVYADLMKALTTDKWRKVLELVAAAGYETDTHEIASVLGLNHDDNLLTIGGMV